MSDRWRAARTGGIVALVGLVVLVACGLVAHNGTVGPTERRVFHAINDLPDWLYRPMWLFQQFGNLAVAFGIVIVLAVVLRKPKLAAAGVLAVVAKLALERVVKKVVHRGRPGSTIGDAILRGQVPQHGFSFVSGHAAITVALATTLMAVLPRRWRPLPWSTRWR